MKISYVVPVKNYVSGNVEKNKFYMYGKASIFRKYSLALKRIKENNTDIVVFMHNDVTILDPLFEKKLKLVFNKFPAVAVVGVIGTKVLNQGGGWWMCNRPEQSFGHIMQGHPDGSAHHMVDNIGFCKDMVSVDGCLFAVRADLLLSGTLKFDHRFDGYHFYDADICVQAKALGYDVAVADILIRHESEGQLDPNWFTNRDIFINKWITAGLTFPLTCDSFTKGATLL